MEGHGRTLAAAAAASVLRNDDLLREILLRLGFPHYLVHAALVSKRWLLQASDPAFLRRFRDRHPPRLLGFFIDFSDGSQLVPLPQPPELAAISSRAASSCDNAFAHRRRHILHCRNGRLITMFFDDTGLKHSLLSPLLAEGSELVLPPTPLPDNNCVYLNWWIYLPEDGRHDGITLVRLWWLGRKVFTEVYVLGSGGWGIPTTAMTEIELPRPTPGWKNVLYPFHGKIFMSIAAGYILGLDLTTSRFFTLKHPDGVIGSNFMLSYADSGLYLLNAEGFQLSIWLHKLTCDDNGGWLLVDTFCVHEECKRVAGDGWVPRVGDCVDIVAAGDNAEFVFLVHEASNVVLYVHLRSRVAEKVYDKHDSVPRMWPHYEVCISPLMMVWPPVFPDTQRMKLSRGTFLLCWILAIYLLAYYWV